MALRNRIKLVPLGDPQKCKDLSLLKSKEWTLKQLLACAPALFREPISEQVLDLGLEQLVISVHKPPAADTPLYMPPGLQYALEPGHGKGGELCALPNEKISGNQDENQAAGLDPVAVPADEAFPQTIREEDAVRMAYAREIDNAASFLRAGLSVLVSCDKLVVKHLYEAICPKAHLNKVVLTVPEKEDGALVPRGLRQRQLAHLKTLIKDLKIGDVLVIPHLDLMAGGGDTNIPTEARELIELVYEASDRLVLAFADRSMNVPEVLAARFAVRLLVSGVSRSVVYPDGTVRPIGKALVTESEAACFEGYDPEELYKNVSGMNPVRLRHAIQYAGEFAREKSETGKIPARDLPQAIRMFKAQTSVHFEVPDVGFEDIGGYEEVKAELSRAIQLITGGYNLDEKLQRQLIPRGFIFHGPPGTGKTLFAKAIANRLNATIQVVSGPEVMDMYVGESERKVRDLFGEARKNAPAVLIFDEFDAIATKRDGRGDGGSRAGNAVVAQMLTEMDGFRPDVPMLVIGTTNRLDIIDEALLRPSRFKAVKIGLPGRTARRAIAAIHSEHFSVPASPELLEVIAAATESMSGDDIQSLFRDACVGMKCQDPPIPADARRFGNLVGALRRTDEERRAAASGQRTSALQTTRSGETPRPSGPMVSLIIPSNPEDSRQTPEPTSIQHGQEDPHE